MNKGIVLSSEMELLMPLYHLQSRLKPNIARGKKQHQEEPKNNLIFLAFIIV